MEQNFAAGINGNFPSNANFTYSINFEECKNDIAFPNTSYHTDISESANNFFARDFSWEYFCNELEFE